MQKFSTFAAACPPSPIQPDNFSANLNWRDGPFKEDISFQQTSFNWRRVCTEEEWFPPRGALQAAHQHLQFTRCRSYSIFQSIQRYSTKYSVPMRAFSELICFLHGTVHTSGFLKVIQT